MIARTCNFCQEAFMAEAREARRGNAKFCSRTCSSKNRVSKLPKPDPNVSCAFCDTKFYLNPSKQRNSKSGLFFCCREHKDFAQRIGGIREIMPPHYGTSPSPDYRELAFSNLPNMCAHCGYSEHVGILEVNHKDLNRSNNSLENLEILCPNCHQAFHYISKTGRYSKMK